MQRRITYTVTKEDQFPTVREILAKKLNMTAREISRAKFLEDGICLNAERCRITQKTELGDVVSVLLEMDQNSAHMIPVEHPLTILYEDEDLLILDKEAGEVVHPSPGHYSDSISNYVASYLQRTEQETMLRSVGRLDKDTSGCLVFAKNRFCAAGLSRQREQGGFHKTYLALASGRCSQEEQFSIHEPIGRVPGSLMKMQVCGEGKAASTECRILKQSEKATLLQVEIKHGRTHQIRVHLASTGHPLIGDRLYGNEEQECRRTLLHAWKIAFHHPVSGVPVIIEAEVPADMKYFLHKLL